MQRNKSIQTHNLMEDIMDDRDNISTTEKSSRNIAWENNRPTNTKISKSMKGRRLTSREMSVLRRLEQIYPGDIQADADSLRGFNVS